MSISAGSWTVVLEISVTMAQFPSPRDRPSLTMRTSRWVWAMAKYSGGRLN